MDTIYRADVIGSLIRPAYLNQARTALRAGTMAPEEFKQLEDRAVKEALALQEAAGVDVVTDGEMRRAVFYALGSGAAQPDPKAAKRTLHWRRQVDGVRQEQETISWVTPITSKLVFNGSRAAEEFRFARAHTSKPLKIAIPAPTAFLTRWSPEHSAAVYPDPVELLADATEMLREEVRALAAVGCDYVQIDAPELCALNDEWRSNYALEQHPKMRDWMRKEGVEALDALATVPGVTFGLHMCRSNHKGFWMSEAPWEKLALEIFPRTRNYHIFLLEYDDWRAGSFEPLRGIAPDKVAVLGLLSTKRAALEPAAEVIARIEQAARYFPRERLALSTQCGFSPAADGSVMTQDEELAKLRLVADIAHQVWG